MGTRYGAWTLKTIAVALSASAWGCSSPEELSGLGGSCLLVTDCQFGLVCVSSKCTTDLSRLVHIEDSSTADTSVPVSDASIAPPPMSDAPAAPPPDVSTPPLPDATTPPPPDATTPTPPEASVPPKEASSPVPEAAPVAEASPPVDSPAPPTEAATPSD
jgi:hypothetical protein